MTNDRMMHILRMMERARNTPIVDDDFPRVLHEADTAILAGIKELQQESAAAQPTPAQANLVPSDPMKAGNGQSRHGEGVSSNAPARGADGPGQPSRFEEAVGKRETQASISAWADETFGPAGSTARVAARANEEMAELLRALTADDKHPKAAEEVADVVIILYRVATRLGFDLHRRIDEKMKVNRARAWKKDGTGHGYHVRARAAETPKEAECSSSTRQSGVGSGTPTTSGLQDARPTSTPTCSAGPVAEPGSPEPASGDDAFQEALEAARRLLHGANAATTTAVMQVNLLNGTLALLRAVEAGR